MIWKSESPSQPISTGNATNAICLRALAIPDAKVLSNGIEKMEDAPGGGHIVTLMDPEGFPISLVHGQVKGQAQAMPDKIIINDVCDKPRVRKFQRYKPGPAAVHKVST